MTSRNYICNYDGEQWSSESRNKSIHANVYAISWYVRTQLKSTVINSIAFDNSIALLDFQPLKKKKPIVICSQFTTKYSRTIRYERISKWLAKLVNK